MALSQSKNTQSLLRLWRYINLLLSLLTYLHCKELSFVAKTLSGDHGKRNAHCLSLSYGISAYWTGLSGHWRVFGSVSSFLYFSLRVQC